MTNISYNTAIIFFDCNTEFKISIFTDININTIKIKKIYDFRIELNTNLSENTDKFYKNKES